MGKVSNGKNKSCNLLLTIPPLATGKFRTSGKWCWYCGMLPESGTSVALLQCLLPMASVIIKGVIKGVSDEKSISHYCQQVISFIPFLASYIVCQWEEGGVAAVPLPLASESGIVSIASFAAPYPLMASQHQWKEKNNWKKKPILIEKTTFNVSACL